MDGFVSFSPRLSRALARARAVAVLVPVLMTVLVGMLVAARCASAASAASAPDPLTVHRGTLDDRLLLTGEVVAEDAIGLIAPNAGVWPLEIRWLIEDGAEVAAGEPVVRFDNSQRTSELDSLLSQLQEAENSLFAAAENVRDSVAEAEFKLAEARAALAKAEVDAAVPPEVFSAQEVERRRLDLDKARLEVTAAEQGLEAARASGEAEIEIARARRATAEREVERVALDIQSLSLAAPRDGLVLVGEEPELARPLRVGDTIFPGLEVARLPVLTSLVVEARLFDVDDGRLAPGQRVVARLDAYYDRPLEGTVREVDAYAGQTGAESARRVFRVLIDLDSIDPSWMLPGMSVKVDVAGGSGRDALLAPRVALDWSETSSFEQARARLADGGWASVELGDCGASWCEVRAGLDDGTRLAPARGLD